MYTVRLLVVKNVSVNLTLRVRIYFNAALSYSCVLQEVCDRIKQAFGPLENLLSIVKRHKLQMYRHVSRSLALAKTILQGTVKWGRRQGRQTKRLEDNIRKWTGLEFAKSQRAVENRESGRNWL